MNYVTADDLITSASRHLYNGFPVGGHQDALEDDFCVFYWRYIKGLVPGVSALLLL